MGHRYLFILNMLFRYCCPLKTELYACALINDWNQISALDITQKLSLLPSFYFVIFESAVNCSRMWMPKVIWLPKCQQSKKWIFKKGIGLFFVSSIRNSVCHENLKSVKNNWVLHSLILEKSQHPERLSLDWLSLVTINTVEIFSKNGLIKLNVQNLSKINFQISLNMFFPLIISHYLLTFDQSC